MYRCKFALILALLFTFLDAKNSLDFEILKAQSLVQNRDFKGAISAYEMLYKSTKKPIFLKEAIKIAFDSNDSKFTKLMAKTKGIILENDPEIIRLNAMILIAKNDFKSAKELVENLAKTDKSDRNFAVLGAIGMFSGDKKEAFLNYQKAYDLSQNADYLVKMILSDKDNEKLIPTLEKYADTNGCEMKFCQELLRLYAQKNDHKNMAKTFTRIYENSQDRLDLERGLGVLIYAKDKDGVDEFLKKHDFSNETKIDAYSAVGDTKRGEVVANEIYKSTNDPKFLAMSAIFEYENALPNVSENTLKSVVAKFEKSAINTQKPLFLNYYGYLLIDHDIDYKKGIKLVQEALKTEPNSPFYLDSLAWGYFKIKECQKAKEIMDKALGFDELKNTDEAKIHTQKIDECLKGKR
ncbi:hypothetical protein [Campylobacter gastrosuis]|uniref:ATP-dependent nuclease subunit B n=1 Tax=Campylobacter gastrosuis TaxID=2974576 RepID=A0ABT7HQH4_9BACT|nr:hypothetical protein [Campylobacter gastrosuis]MDL0089160.1 hypothetical protein [Campylobacter gastrosuis]